MRLLLTGASGSFGSALIRILLAEGAAEKIIAFSRSESAQARLREALGRPPQVQWMLGDVRDPERLWDAMHRIDTIVHAAALKRVDDNAPMELYRTNIDGTRNVVRAAIKRNVPRVLVLSTDKACAPVTAYGASKLAAEFEAVDANRYGQPQVRIACTRWGNVLGSQGSVIHTWRGQIARGEPLTITDPRATRFLLTLEEAVGWARRFLACMVGSEVFVPALPACTVGALATAVGGADYPHVRVPVRAGEKRDEVLISADESYRALPEAPAGYYVLGPPRGLVFDNPSWQLCSLGARRLSVAELTTMLTAVPA